MASTYSTNLAIELIGTGDQAGTWGTTTNNNLGTLIEQAISGYVTQTITDGADTVITIPNGATGVARNMCIQMTGALTAARNLIVPNKRKLYFIHNATSGGFAVTVKTSAGSGISVIAGQKTVLICDGTDVISAIDSLEGPATIIANSSADALRITQTGAGNALLVQDSANPDATPFAITASGDVIAGYPSTTPNPSAFLAKMQLNAFVALQLYYADNGAFGAIQYIQKSRGTEAVPTAVYGNDNFGSIVWTGYDGAAFRSTGAIAVSGAGSGSAVTAGQPIPGIMYLQVTPVGGGSGLGDLDNQMVISGYGINVGLTAASSSEAVTFNIGKNLGGQPNAYSAAVRNAVQSTVTSTATSFYSAPSTAAAAFTLAEYQHFTASPVQIGVGSTVTLQVGFRVATSFNTATNNIGFLSSVPAGSGEYNFYADTQAENIFYGNTRFGALTTPVATVDVTGSVGATTTILSSGATSGVGYATGAGGTVTQLTSRTTPVTLNKITGQITLVSATTTAGTLASFTVTNSAVAATDVVIVNFASGATADRYGLSVTQVSAGSFRIQIHNIAAVAVAEAPVINFAVIKGVTA
jgi:hypothetical protein